MENNTKTKLRATDFTVNRRQAAKRLGVSYKTLSYLKIPYFKVGYSHVRYREKDIDRIEAEGIHEPEAV